MQIAVSVLSVALFLAWLVFIYRTWKAYKLRIRLMKDDLDAYFGLPSLGVMVLQFWRPLSSFIEEAKQDALEEEAPSHQQKPGS